MNTTQAQRLVNVANALRDADLNHWFFDMDSWGYDPKRFNLGERGNPKFTMPENEVDFIDEHKCGTPACALGHYAVRPDLQGKFKLTKEGNLRMRTESRPVLGEEVDLGSLQMHQYFGISYDEAQELFAHDGCDDAQTPLAAARYIERFVRSKGYVIS